MVKCAIMARIKQITRRALYFLLGVTLVLILATRSSSLLTDPSERVRAFTRSIEFDYVSWTANALSIKLAQYALGTPSYLNTEGRHEVTRNYLQLLAQIQKFEAQLSDIYADPYISNPAAASIDVRKQLGQLYTQRADLAPVAESVLQEQVSSVIAEMGLAMGDQPVPAVLYHATPLPMALIISPRDAIRQDNDISLLPDLTIDQQVALEGEVDRSANVSSLVVPIGGVGLYPTMVSQTTDMNWLAEVVSHEWTHNFLTIRPLGMNYMTSPELRTINETTASISGKEIGEAVIQRYYPELIPVVTAAPPPSAPSTPKPAQPAFDYRAEMRLTRVTVDHLLAAKKIGEAESYMEQRRKFFWDHGYHIRKLNQAYFAFYGAYADQPGGAAGEDPVGAAVRKLRAESSSLANFLYKIAWVSSLPQLQELVAQK